VRAAKSQTTQILNNGGQVGKSLAIFSRFVPMKKRSPVREPARVLMHLNGGYTCISLIRTEGVGMANGGATWDIPTEAIPPQLRSIGSQFLIVVPRFAIEDHDSPDDIRRMTAEIEIHELTGQDKFTEF
jgi:hypothetical protein